MRNIQPNIMHHPEKESNRDKRIKIGITHGDLNGISYEVIIKALNDNRLFDNITPIIYGSSKALSYHRNGMKYHDFNYKIIKSADDVIHQKVNIINVSNEEVRIEYGKSDPVAGKFAFLALEEAVKDLKEEKIQVLVTGPLNKHNIQSDAFDFPGHTEYLAAKFESNASLMLMVKDQLRIGVVTGHIPLARVAESITSQLILQKLEIIRDTLVRDFGIEKPKIAVLGINPHAGDQGVIGHEDQEKLVPAIEEAWDNGILAFGPFPADGFFGSSAFLKYDAILAMYHDQGLIPFKTLAFEGGVNFTAGLPIVRTSPAHGTAYDKAGQNQSSPAAMREALYLALDIYRNRLQYDELTHNPLQSGQIQDFQQNRNNKEPDEMKRAED
ncbi:MAG: 4-hydroxythreonine-4-phosphate dehydrogenase PdxA [bacterium]